MSLMLCAAPYCEGLQSLASAKSIVVPSDARSFDYNGICSEFRCFLLNSAIHCIFCRKRCSERAYWANYGERSGWFSKEYLDVG
jgi:hypothetical protein